MTKPLRILAFGGIEQWPEIQILMAQGHEEARTLDEADLVLGPTAHRMDERLRKYLPEAVKEMRRRKYGLQKGEE